MDPFGFCDHMSKTYWSEWLESIRKDVECCFGILKTRFRILLDSLKYHKEKDITAIFKTCCILHNMLLRSDQLHFVLWESAFWSAVDPDAGVVGHDDTVVTEIDAQEDTAEVKAEEPEVNPLPAARIPFLGREFKAADFGDYNLKRHAMATHFSYRFNRRQLEWPRRNEVGVTSIARTIQARLDPQADE